MQWADAMRTLASAGSFHERRSVSEWWASEAGAPATATTPAKSSKLSAVTTEALEMTFPCLQIEVWRALAATCGSVTLSSKQAKRAAAEIVYACRAAATLAVCVARAPTQTEMADHIVQWCAGMAAFLSALQALRLQPATSVSTGYAALIPGALADDVDAVSQEWLPGAAGLHAGASTSGAAARILSRMEDVSHMLAAVGTGVVCLSQPSVASAGSSPRELQVAATSLLQIVVAIAESSLYRAGNAKRAFVQFLSSDTLKPTAETWAAAALPPATSTLALLSQVLAACGSSEDATRELRTATAGLRKMVRATLFNADTLAGYANATNAGLLLAQAATLTAESNAASVGEAGASKPIHLVKPHIATQESRLFTVLAAEVASPRAASSATAALRVLPFLLDAYVRVRRALSSGDDVSAATSTAAGAAAAGGPSVPAAVVGTKRGRGHAGVATNAADEVAAATVAALTRAPEFAALAELLAIATDFALPASTAGAAPSSGSGRGAEAGLTQKLPDLRAALRLSWHAADAASWTMLLARVQAVAGLCHVAAQRSLFTIHADVAPSPQTCVLQAAGAWLQAAAQATVASLTTDTPAPLASTRAAIVTAVSGGLACLLDMHHSLLPLPQACAALQSVSLLTHGLGADAAATTAQDAVSTFAASLLVLHGKLRNIGLALTTLAGVAVELHKTAPAALLVFVLALTSRVSLLALSAAFRDLPVGQVTRVADDVLALTTAALHNAQTCCVVSASGVGARGEEAVAPAAGTPAGKTKSKKERTPHKSPSTAASTNTTASTSSRADAQPVVTEAAAAWMHATSVMLAELLRQLAIGTINAEHFRTFATGALHSVAAAMWQLAARIDGTQAGVEPSAPCATATLHAVSAAATLSNALTDVIFSCVPYDAKAAAASGAIMGAHDGSGSSGGVDKNTAALLDVSAPHWPSPSLATTAAPATPTVDVLPLLARVQQFVGAQATTGGLSTLARAADAAVTMLAESRLRVAHAALHSCAALQAHGSSGAPAAVAVTTSRLQQLTCMLMQHSNSSLASCIDVCVTYASAHDVDALLRRMFLATDAHAYAADFFHEAALYDVPQLADALLPVGVDCALQLLSAPAATSGAPAPVVGTSKTPKKSAKGAPASTTPAAAVAAVDDASLMSAMAARSAEDMLTALDATLRSAAATPRAKGLVVSSQLQACFSGLAAVDRAAYQSADADVVARVLAVACIVLSGVAASPVALSAADSLMRAHAARVIVVALSATTGRLPWSTCTACLSLLTHQPQLCFDYPAVLAAAVHAAMCAEAGASEASAWSSHARTLEREPALAVAVLAALCHAWRWSPCTPAGSAALSSAMTTHFVKPVATAVLRAYCSDSTAPSPTSTAAVFAALQIHFSLICASTTPATPAAHATSARGSGKKAAAPAPAVAVTPVAGWFDAALVAACLPALSRSLQALGTAAPVSAPMHALLVRGFAAGARIPCTADGTLSWEGAPVATTFQSSTAVLQALACALGSRFGSPHDGAIAFVASMSPSRVTSFCDHIAAMLSSDGECATQQVAALAALQRLVGTLADAHASGSDASAAATELTGAHRVVRDVLITKVHALLPTVCSLASTPSHVAHSEEDATASLTDTSSIVPASGLLRDAVMLAALACIRELLAHPKYMVLHYEDMSAMLQCATSALALARASVSAPAASGVRVEEGVVAVCAVLTTLLKFRRDFAMAALPSIAATLPSLFSLLLQLAFETTTFHADARAVVAFTRLCEQFSRIIVVTRYHAVHTLAAMLSAATLLRKRGNGELSAVLPSDVRDAFAPAVFYLLDVCGAPELQQLHIALSGRSVARSLLKTLHAQFEATHKYTGKG